jgi:starch synthase
MRVALVSFAFGEQCVPLATALSRHVEVSLLLPRAVVEPHLKMVGDRVHLEPFDHPRLRQVPAQLRLCRRLIRTLERLDPDVVHLQHGHLWLNLHLRLLRGRPLVVSIHDPRFHVGDRESRRTPQRVADIGYRRADKVITHTERMKEIVVAHCGIPSERVHVVPLHGVGGGPEADGSESPEPMEADPRPTVLFFGRIWAYKGLEYLIRAQPLISEHVPDARFVIAGRGEDFSRYRRMMRDPGGFEVHNEYVSEEERARLFERATVVVLPYVEATQSAVITVAYAHGRPVVATDVGGLPEQVDDGVTGYLVPPADDQALAEAVVRILRDPGLAERLGAAARRKAELEWSPDLAAERTLAVYRIAAGVAPATRPVRAS